MALSSNTGKFALATSFAVMTASSTVYAQVGPSEDSLEGSVVTEDASRQGTQATIRSVQTGVRSSLKSQVFYKLFTGPNGKKFGGPAMRDATQNAMAEPYFFGPKLDTPEDDDASLSGGLAAGDIATVLEGFGTWANVNMTLSQSDAAGTTSDTELGVISVGIDHPVNDQFILGLSASLSLSRTDADFNTAAVGPANLLNNSDTFSLAPYAAYILNENVYFDALVGVSRGDARIEQTVKATGAVVSTGRQRSTSQFAAITGNYIDVIGDNYGLLASAGLTWSQTLNEDYTDDQGVIRASDDSVDSQFIAGAEIGRPLEGGMHIPYVFGYIEQDLTPSLRGGANGEQPTDSRLGLRLGAGMDTIYDDTLVLSFEGGALLLKEDYLELGASVNLRWDF